MLLLGLACAPCDVSPAVRDPRGSWTADKLSAVQDSLDTWISSVGAGRVCIAGVEVSQVIGQGSARSIGGRTVFVDPDPVDFETPLYRGLCEALAEDQELVERFAALDPSRDFQLTKFFPTRCSWGPRDYRWLAQREAACGGNDLDSVDQFFRDEVYVNEATARVDGEVATGVGTPLVIEGIESGERNVMEVVQAGEGIAIRVYDPDAAYVVEVETETGAVTEWAPGAVPSDGALRLYGGPGGAVLHVRDRDTDAVTVQRVGSDVAIESEGSADAYGVVNEGWLYTASNALRTEPLHALDLTTGERRTIELPAPSVEGRHVLVSGLAAAPGGFVANTSEASVEDGVDGTFVHRSVERWLRWVDGGFVALTEGVDDFDVAGNLDETRVVGRLYSDAGDVLAAYDIAEDSLHVSSDYCVGEDWEAVAAAGRVWQVEGDDTDLVLTPVVVE